MAVFDAYIKKLAGKIEGLREKGKQIREFDCPTTVSELLETLPIRVGSQANPAIILRGDTFVELGSPDAGSCALLVWTDNLSLIRDGKITLVGPDIQESSGASLPFGQVLMLGGTEITYQEHSLLEQTQFVSDKIEGYMIRSTSERMWSRVSNDAASKGFSFEILGRALMALYKSEIPQVQAMEAVFVTSDKEDLKQFESIATQVRDIGSNIVRENWLAKGFDILECNFGWDCNSCDYKPVCDDIREVITIRKSRDRSVGTTSE